LPPLSVNTAANFGSFSMTRTRRRIRLPSFFRMGLFLKASLTRFVRWIGGRDDPR
jgi:hypothetical protein